MRSTLTNNSNCQWQRSPRNKAISFSKPMDLWSNITNGWQFLHTVYPIIEQTNCRGRHGERTCSNYVETQSHILQKYACTHSRCIQRHDSITQLIADKFIGRGWQVTWAPRLQTSTGCKKPDLIIYNQGKLQLWTSPLFGTPQNLSQTQDKLDLYDQQPVCANITTAYRMDKEIQFGAIVKSHKGTRCHCNEAALSFLHLPMTIRDILITRCMEKSYKINQTLLKIT